MFSFSYQISLGDVLIFGTGIIAWYAGYIRQGEQIKQLWKAYNELRRGRGLIMGDDSDWPDKVLWCFGRRSRPNPHGE